jgi:hypothetical protein
MKKELANYLNNVKRDHPKCASTLLPLAQEAKFELLNYRSNKRGVTWEGGESISFYDYTVKLTDADGEVVKYSITDYYNKEMNEITDTRIWVLTDKVLELELIENDSRLGIKILGFITSEHFFRNDVLESMYVKDMEDKIDSYYEK